MAELVVVGFEGKHRAAEVLAQLEVLNDLSAIDLKDAVAVYRTDDGRLRFDQSVQRTTGEGAAEGALLGALIGALLMAPFTGGVSVAAAAGAMGIGATAFGLSGAAIGADDASSFKEDYGITDDFVKQVGGMVQPGQSAVFVLATASDPQVVAEQFRGYGGTVLRTTLPADAAARFQKLMAPHSAVLIEPRYDCGLRILADSELTAIEDRRLSEGRGERRSAHILNPCLIADPRWRLVLSPQESSIRSRQ